MLRSYLIMLLRLASMALWAGLARAQCVTCPPGSIPEGEQICFEGYSDHYNVSGCSTSNILTCPDGGSVNVCGTYGVFPVGNGQWTRDEDSYRIELTSQSRVRACLNGSLLTEIELFRSQTILGVCYTFFTGISSSVNPCGNGCIEGTLASGTVFIRVRPSFVEPLRNNCGAAYVLTVAVNPPSVAALPQTWSAVKTLFRD